MSFLTYVSRDLYNTSYRIQLAQEEQQINQNILQIVSVIGQLSAQIGPADQPDTPRYREIVTRLLALSQISDRLQFRLQQVKIQAQAVDAEKQSLDKQRDKAFDGFKTFA